MSDIKKNTEQNLIETTPLGFWNVKGADWKDLGYIHPKVYGCLAKLKDYEATGLTPDQIQQIDYLYEEKCKEVAQLRREQDLQLKLPCKVKDTVYLHTFCENVIGNYDSETNILACPFENDCEFEECNNCNERLFKTVVDSIFNNGYGWYILLAGLSMEIPATDMGRIIFLTRSEAEAALKRMKVEND